MTIQEIAAQHDAAIIADKEGDIAIQKRHYQEGIKQVRYAPDAGDHYPREKWESWSENEIQTKIC